MYGFYEVYKLHDLASLVSGNPKLFSNHGLQRLSCSGAYRTHNAPNPSCVLLIALYYLVPIPWMFTLDIRDARDAHILLESVRLNILPLITRRLSSNERDQLSSGNVFVWEEADFKGGLERWTDGRRWYVGLILLF